MLINPINLLFSNITKPTGNNSTEKLVHILWDIPYVCLTTMILKSSVQHTRSLFWVFLCYKIKQNYILQYLYCIHRPSSFVLFTGGHFLWNSLWWFKLTTFPSDRQSSYIIDPTVMMHSTCHEILALIFLFALLWLRYQFNSYDLTLSQCQNQ